MSAPDLCDRRTLFVVWSYGQSIGLRIVFGLEPSFSWSLIATIGLRIAIACIGWSTCRKRLAVLGELQIRSDQRTIPFASDCIVPTLSPEIDPNGVELGGFHVLFLLHSRSFGLCNDTETADAIELDPLARSQFPTHDDAQIAQDTEYIARANSRKFWNLFYLLLFAEIQNY